MSNFENPKSSISLELPPIQATESDPCISGGRKPRKGKAYNLKESCALYLTYYFEVQKHPSMGPQQAQCN